MVEEEEEVEEEEIGSDRLLLRTRQVVLSWLIKRVYYDMGRTVVGTRAT